MMFAQCVKNRSRLDGCGGLDPEPLDGAAFFTCFSDPKLGAIKSDFPLALSSVRVFQGRLNKMTEHSSRAVFRGRSCRA